MVREIYCKSSAPPGLAFRGNKTSQVLNDLLAQCQSYPRAGIHIFTVQPLKQLEYFAAVLWLESNAIVCNGNHDI